MERKERYNKKLLVEGKDDQSVIWSLAKKFALIENFDVIDCENYEKAIDSLPLRIKSSGINTVGIIVDADEDLESKWKSIIQRLQKYGYQIPVQIPIEGLIIEKSNDFDVKVGVWIMPNNNTKGKVEDFVRFLIPDNDNLREVTDNTLEFIESKKINKYEPKDKAKAYIHTWLAWQKTPGQRMGTAITSNYFNLDVEECHNFINWLKLLFNKEEKD